MKKYLAKLNETAMEDIGKNKRLPELVLQLDQQRSEQHKQPCAHQLLNHHKYGKIFQVVSTES